MRKAKLSLDALNVETFEPDATVVSPRGTVHAHEFTQVTSLCQGCTRAPSCAATCSTDAHQVCYEPLTRDPNCE